MKNNMGFSIIEVMTVVAIMIILMTIGVPAYRSWRNRSQIAKARSTIAKLEMALERYKTENGNYPNSGELNRLIDDGPYIDRKDYVGTDFIDPWRVAYVYTTVGNYFTITSNGPDTLPGTADDLTNEEQTY